MALALLAIGLSVGNKIHQADLRITILSDALGREDRLDQAFYVTSNPYRITINPVLKVDEASYDPAKIWPGQVGKRMGGDHPEAWFQQYEKGRVFVTLLWHNVEMYRDERYLQHLLGGIYWTATGLGRQR